MSAAQQKDEGPIAALLAPDLLILLEEAPGDLAVETEELHPKDLADVVEAMPLEPVLKLLSVLPPERAADVLEYLDEDLRTEVLEAMSPETAAVLVAEMRPDDRADALEELEEGIADDILAQIPAEARRETERLLAYEPDTAGGLMTPEFVSVAEHTTAEEALRGVRAVARSGRREALYTIYATDVEGRVRGVISLRELLAAPEGARISDIAREEVRTVPPTADRELVARITSEYDLVAVPVVDDMERILGVVTVDDVIDAIVEESTEDVQKMGGLEALDEPYMQIGLPAMLRKRGGWLTVLFIGEMFTASAMGYFENEIEQAVVLALFIPLIIASGGNSGSQATSLIIRAMALREVQLGDWWRVARRELPSGLALGAILGALGVLRVIAWHRLGWYDYGVYYHLIAATVGLSLLGVVTFGSVTGSMLPFVMRRFGFDPASASAPFVATLVDVTGVVMYFSVALLLLSGTLL